ncbi:lipocalin family protein [Mucilaginibacter glaciei]|uniref:Lipocalin family protein n=1 Tax=Mucilaginibacter glaciei TaxID=2772109 RepID=A0A926NY03_9SPHI|nr:lipocalin family protein [Mucilaginibacter glaciei]MBD1393928.1 lipocalin family protein [Mucilaginibacter glaciei]
MKSICTILLFIATSFAGVPNKPVERVDIKKYSGRWYSLYSIPTAFDKGSIETTTNYTWNDNKEYFDVVTTYKKANDTELHSVKSKLFLVENTNNAEMKAQFLWPFKVDYWVVDLAPDYSYVVVGHPDHKFLFIMSRKPSLDKKTYDTVIAKCKAMGYPVEKLTSQKHGGS